MSKTCFDIAKEVIERASKVFGSEWKLNEESYDIFREYCDFMDKIAAESKVDGIGVSVDRIKKTIKVTMTCGYFSPEETMNAYYELVKRAVSVGFYQKDEKVAAYLEFPSLWVS